MSEDSSKTCRDCGEVKSRSEFYARRAVCKACVLAIHAEKCAAKRLIREAEQAAMTEKSCTVCGVVKPLGEFRPRKNGKRGKFSCNSACKQCYRDYDIARWPLIAEQKRTYNAERYAADPERFRAEAAARREAHPGYQRKYNVERYWADPERFRAERAAQRKANPPTAEQREQACIRARAWYAANPERARIQRARWFAANPERKRAIDHRRWTARREWIQSSESPPTVDQLVEILEDPCVYCGAEANEWEHIRPRLLGGQHVVSNIVASCMQCNRGVGGKFSKSLLEWDPARVWHAVCVSSKVAAEWDRQTETMEEGMYG